MTVERILVTGATGRVGGALIRALQGRAHVIAAARDPDGVNVSGQDGVAWRRFDFAVASTHTSALDEVEAVFLMRPPHMARARAFAPFLDAVADAKVARLTMLSVRGADRVPVLPHHGIERLVRNRLPWAAILRPADFMQNLETVHRDEIARNGEIVAPTGLGRSAFVDADDVAAAAATTLLDDAHRGRSYTLTGPEALGFDAVARILSEELGRLIVHRSPAPPRFVARRVRGGTPLAMTLVMTGLYTAQRLGFADGVTQELPRLLGRPASDLRDYVIRRRAVWDA